MGRVFRIAFPFGRIMVTPVKVGVGPTVLLTVFHVFLLLQLIPPPSDSRRE